MALGENVIDLLTILRAMGAIPEKPTVIELGAQQLSDAILKPRERLDELGRLFGAVSPCPLPPPLNASSENGALAPNLHLAPDAPKARDFWTWLGFDYTAIDIDASLGGLALDLNFDEVPDGAKGQFDIVTNFGTTEHILNQLNAFKVIHDLAAPGGAMLHDLPSQGMLNHGLVNYNPKFLWMLSRSNGYKWLYANFTADSSSYGLPSNISDHVRQFVPDIEVRLGRYRASDCSTVAMLQKTYDIAFVPALDFAADTAPIDPRLEERYWTLFKPNAFATLRADTLPRRR